MKENKLEKYLFHKFYCEEIIRAKSQEDMHGRTMLNPSQPYEGFIIPAAKSKKTNSI